MRSRGRQLSTLLPPEIDYNGGNAFVLAQANMGLDRGLEPGNLKIAADQVPRNFKRSEGVDHDRVQASVGGKTIHQKARV